MKRAPFGLRLLCRAVTLVPPSADPLVAGLAAWFARRLTPRRTRFARANYAALFPGRKSSDHARMAARAHVAYARFLIEYLRALRLDRAAMQRRIGLAVSPEVFEALRAGRGVVVAAAHLGNWEIGALALPRLGQRVSVVAGPQLASGWRDAMLRAKRESGLSMVTPEEAPAALIETLREGGVVVLLADGDGYERGRPARIAGHWVSLPAGAARLAARTGALLASGSCSRIGPMEFRVEVRPLAETGRRPVRDANLLHAAVAAWLETELLTRPGEWCVFRPFFEPIAALAPEAPAAPPGPPAPAESPALEPETVAAGEIREP